MTSFSVVIVTYNRISLLKRTLNSIRNSRLIPVSTIVVVNGDDSESATFIKVHFPEVTLKVVVSMTPGEARNCGVALCSEEYILFLDDDAEIPEDYTLIASRFTSTRPTASVFGGPDSTHANASLYEESVGQTLKSPLATAHTRLRHSNIDCAPTRCDDSSLILCALWFKRELFSSFQFDSRFFRNEENILIKQLITHGEEVWYVPGLIASHRRREKAYDFSKGVFGSAYYRMKSIMFFRDHFSSLFFVPALFVLYLVTLPLSFSCGGDLIALIYLFIVTYFSLRLSKGSFTLFILNIINHIIINIAYGLGTIFFFARFSVRRNKMLMENYAN